MKLYLYLLAGISSALLGWNIGQFFITDLGLFPQYPEIILFPCIAVSLSCSMVMNEIFISNPTRVKRSFETAKQPLLIATGLGIISGLVAGIISQILFWPVIRVPTPIVRTLGWLLIGVSVGLAEGLTWRWHSMEASGKKRLQQRLKISVIAASGASLMAAVLFEILRLTIGKMPPDLKSIEDIIGFSILGLLLGAVFSVTNSPSYIAALRAGKGFEYKDFKEDTQDVPSYSLINSHQLSFVNNVEETNDIKPNEIQEGLSIQLPARGKIRIGSDSINTDITIPGLPPHIADIEIQKRAANLIPDSEFFHAIAVNGVTLRHNRQVALRHNYLLTLYTVNKAGVKEEKYYRFVYYNRFLDPQA